MAHAGHQWRASGTAALGMEAVGKQKPQPWGRGGGEVGWSKLLKEEQKTADPRLDHPYPPGNGLSQLHTES